MAHRTSFQPDQRLFRCDFVAIGLLLAGLLVALSVFSYQPADPPGSLVYPRHREAQNLLGSGGAALALALHDTLGVAVYVLLVIWFLVVVLLVARRSFFTWFLRL